MYIKTNLAKLPIGLPEHIAYVHYATQSCYQKIYIYSLNITCTRRSAVSSLTMTALSLPLNKL